MTAASLSRRILTGLLVGMLLLMVVVLSLMLTSTGPLFTLAGSEQTLNFVPLWGVACVSLGQLSAFSGWLDAFSGKVFAAM